MKLSVKTFREVGMQAKWGKCNGGPALFVRDPSAKTEHQRSKWWLVTQTMYVCMKQSGIKEGFDQNTLLGDMFSVSA